MTLHQFILILRSRWRAALFVLLAALLAAAAVSLLLPKKYVARAAVLVDVRAADPVSGAAAMSGMVAPSYMATQVDIIAGDQVAQRVVRTLRLDEKPGVRDEWMKATDGRGTLDAWLIGSLQRNLDVRPARESNVISISYRSADPEQAALLANSFAQAYLDTTINLKTEPARQYAEWFDAQAKASRAKLEEAQAKLSDYQQKAGIVNTDERSDYETARLSELSSQLTRVQGETTDSQSKRGARGDSVAEVMQSPLVNGLKADIARLEAKVQEASTTLGVNHPMRQRAESELASLRSRLRSETAQISGSIETAYQVGKARERELAGAVAAQRQRVMRLNKERDDLNVYRRDVESAQKAYDAVMQNASQTRLQSLSNQTNVVRLDNAGVPLSPSSPNLGLNLLIAAFGGTLLAIGFALLLELRNRRIRSPEDLIQMLDLPVLATLSSGTRLARLPPHSTLALGRTA
ncbi:MAG: chain length determinant protein EpsF [Comamonadaceae bacterium]|nr:MAG: chain length determinant protein EpsF [Comamonadaceae bacterium]